MAVAGPLRFRFYLVTLPPDVRTMSVDGGGAHDLDPDIIAALRPIGWAAAIFVEERGGVVTITVEGPDGAFVHDAIRDESGLGEFRIRRRAYPNEIVRTA